MEKCNFCNLSKSNKVIFKTKSFIFLKDNFPVYKGHHLLVSKRHIRSENEINKKELQDYYNASKKAFNFIRLRFNKEPMIFINAQQDQSVKHFHKHYIPGVFGVLGVLNALKKIVKKKL